MEVVYKLDDGNFLQGRDWHWGKYGARRHLWIVAGIVFIVVGIVNISGNPPLYSAVLFYGSYCIFRKWILKLFFLRNLRTNPNHGNIATCKFTDDALEYVVGDSYSETTWKSIFETISTRDGWLVYPSKNIYIWIPKTHEIDEIQKSRIDGILAEKTSNRILA